MAPGLKFYGSQCFRQRILLSLLTAKPIVIDAIRPDENGLDDSEKSLLDLVTKITTGCKVGISRSRLSFNPGSIIGGEVNHDCDVSRSISFYLEFILCLAPFAKQPFQLTLKGVTNDQDDPSVDALRDSSLNLMKRFIGDIEGSKLAIKVNARGFKPNGGGSITFTCPVVRQLNPVQFLKAGKVKKIRGLSIAARVSPQMANRMISESKGLMLNLISDIYISSDHKVGSSSGLSPGFAISLFAETTENCIYTASAASNSKGSGLGPSIPEDVGRECVVRLLMEIDRGGCVDSINQTLAFTLMAFNQKDISQVTIGQLTPNSINFLRHLKKFCGLTFRLESSEGSQEIVASCEGLGYKNLSRRTL